MKVCRVEADLFACPLEHTAYVMLSLELRVWSLYGRVQVRERWYSEEEIRPGQRPAPATTW